MIVRSRSQRLWFAFIASVFMNAVSAAESLDSRLYRIGVLNEAWAASHPTVEGLKAGLRELGLDEGRGVTFDIRFTEGNPAAMPGVANGSGTA